MRSLREAVVQDRVHLPAQEAHRDMSDKYRRARPIEKDSWQDVATNIDWKGLLAMDAKRRDGRSKSSLGGQIT